jgi:hypothetical protein
MEPVVGRSRAREPAGIVHRGKEQARKVEGDLRDTQRVFETKQCLRVVRHGTYENVT